MAPMKDAAQNPVSPCPVCKGTRFTSLFSKKGGDTDYTLFRCTRCSHRMLQPLPAEDSALYEDNYFMQRTDRGYNNYFSAEVRCEIERVLALNFAECGFDGFEAKLETDKHSLDIGCAAGYCVSWLRSRGWHARGIDISHSCVNHARAAGLDVECGDYLSTRYELKFELITLWATIEHLRDPAAVIAKIAADLAPGGSLIISTCNVSSPFAALKRRAWRFYNFPEHIHFFTTRGLNTLLKDHALIPRARATYGSGLFKPHTLLRKLADRIAKTGSGDMLLLRAEKAEHQ